MPRNQKLTDTTVFDFSKKLSYYRTHVKKCYIREKWGSLYGETTDGYRNEY